MFYVICLKTTAQTEFIIPLWMLYKAAGGLLGPCRQKTSGKNLERFSTCGIEVTTKIWDATSHRPPMDGSPDSQTVLLCKMRPLLFQCLPAFLTKGLMSNPVFHIQDVSWPFRGVSLWKRWFLTVWSLSPVAAEKGTYSQSSRHSVLC